MSDVPFRITPSWEDAFGIQAPELAATWARITINVKDQFPTWVSGPGGSTRNSIYVSAYPLAEWIAFNWWFLVGEQRASVVPVEAWTWRRADEHPWLHRHNMRGAGAGMSWPDLTLVPEGSLMHVSWVRRSPGDGDRGLSYLSSGAERFLLASARDALAEFVGAVIERLRHQGIARTPLDDEWSRISALSPDEVDFAEATARLGLDSFDVPDSVADKIIQLDRRLAPGLLAEFLDTVDADDLEAGEAWIREVEVRRASAASSRLDVGDLGVMLSASPRSDLPPWSVGYDAARRVRAALDASPRDVLDLTAHISVFAVDRANAGIEGYVIAEEHPVLGVPAGSASTRHRRFQSAHSIGLMVLEPGRRRFILDPSHTDLAQAARAFAAELIAPAEGIAAYLDALPRVSDGAIEAIADRFETSATVIRRQYENQLQRL